MPEERRKFKPTSEYRYLAHGEPDAAEAMAEHIRERFDWNVVVPQYEQTVELK